MIVAKLYTVNKEFIDAVPCVSLKWTRQSNKEYTFTVEFSSKPPDNFYYVVCIDQDSSIKFIPSGYVASSSSDTEFTMNSWETALESEGWIPDDWEWWDSKLLSTVIADHCYGFRKIGCAGLSQLEAAVSTSQVQMAEIDDGNGSVYLDTYGYFVESSETEIAYYSSGYAIYKIEIPDEARRSGMVLRWSDSVGTTTDISVQFRWSDSATDYSGEYTTEESPARSDNVNPNETVGIDIPESSLAYLFVKFNLKYDSGEDGENYENEITTEDDIVYYGKTPLLSAFEVIYRVATSVVPGTITVDATQTLTADIHDKSDLLESLKAIAEAYDISFLCTIDSEGEISLNAYSDYGDNIRDTAGCLSDIKNATVSDKTETLDIYEGCHCFGSGDGIDRLYAFVKMDGVDVPKRITTFEDDDITSISDLQTAGSEYLEDENSVSSTVAFEYYGTPLVSLHDNVAISVLGTVYENKISEESITCDDNGVSTRKYTIGTKAYPFRKLYGYSFSGTYLKTPVSPSCVTTKEVDGTWYISWIGTADSYLVEYKRSDATVWSRTTVTTNYCIVSNIVSGTEYLFRIYSVLDGLLSIASTTVSTAGNSEDQLTPDEKTQYRIDWVKIASEVSVYDALAIEYGMTEEKTAYDTSFANLANYLNGGTTWVSGIPLWLSDDQLNTTTIIDYDVWTSMWTSYSNSLIALEEAIRLLFSISISITSKSAIRNRAGIISPSAISVSAIKSDGSVYSGRFIISGTPDGITYVDLYSSTTDESTKLYNIPLKLTIESVEYYSLAIRIRLYKSGGTSIKLAEDSCIISLSQDTTPIYFGSMNSAPTTGLELVNDYYFDSNLVGNGGGVIRYYNGSVWVEATTSWAMYANAVSSAMTDMMVWVGSTGGTIAAANAVFESIVASSAFINKLSTANQYSAQMCDDGITPRMEIDWDNAVATFRSGDQEYITKITENKIIAYEGAGLARRSVSIESGSVNWYNSPDGGIDELIGRLFRKSAGAGPILMEGDFQYKIDYDIAITDFYERTISATSRDWRGVAWSPELGLFVMTAYGSTVCATSPDGITWTERTISATSRNWRGVAWSPELGLFVMTASSGTFCATSPDGITWTERTISATSRIWYEVAWSPELGLFVMTASNSTVCATSPNGITWTERTISATSRNWCGVAWSPELGLFVMTAYGSTVCATSPDGITWTERTISETPRSWYGIAWSPELGLFVMIAYGSTVCATYKLYDYQKVAGYPQSGYVSGRGWWTKFADGTLIQRGSNDMTVALVNQNIGTYGWSYYVAGQAILFPLEFYGTTDDFDIATSSFMDSGALKSQGVTGVYLYRKDISGTTRAVSWIAIGRWKA